MHSFLAGQDHQRGKLRGDQPIEPVGGHVGQLAPIDLEVLDRRAAPGQFVTEQVAPGLAAENGDAFAVHLLQVRRRQQCLAVVGRIGHQQAARFADVFTQGFMRRRADDTKHGVGGYYG